MKTTAFLVQALLAMSLAGGAQGAAIVQESHPPMATPSPELPAQALMFPVPKFPNPWDNAAGAEPEQAGRNDGRAEQAMALPAANYPFESHANDHARAEVARTAQSSRISEPASELLMLAGLSALAIAIRRKMPE
jgi:hypothetical protein